MTYWSDIWQSRSRQCRDCGVEAPASAFKVGAQLSSECRDCRNRNKRTQRQSLRENTNPRKKRIKSDIVAGDRFVCCGCSAALTLDARAHRRGYFCRPCVAALEANRRARTRAKSDGSVNPVAIRNQPICFYCRAFTPREQRTLEHVIPIKLGGRHVAENVTMACHMCNSTKRASHPWDYYWRLS